ncbi:sensor histidine kinase [Cellulomonas fimi]|uniref:histidine kinase n=1 Tax=Cellulomonas fimi (strain ATCC 484 / DSM 20113 / JCM 1341 / CCUG 24087 / LMG 16345 / NBRC 15513 / NCIMB 8980 / NCTC 7547 / NRS-133) TaxID=590998 RepID=F4H886_CELFA|nr:histidine kinase [Cellulomonas fimi]AEE44643.1 integral membrane sensor signal transduction histidine kinase [Cellulomonas fimi ATCC 484]NNH08992.1 two-component sensor histidine kinase [Cellulomonas fimi]VEH26874.1 Sensor histidine kinase desK [Cellulomonas fimi]
MTPRTASAWGPDVASGLAVLALGCVEATSRAASAAEAASLLLVAGTIALAVSLSRHRPGVALALVWGTGLLQVAGEADVMLVQLAVGVVAFGCARWGSTETVWASALSVPVAAVIAVLTFGASSLAHLTHLLGLDVVVRAAYTTGDRWEIGAVVVGTALLGAPWLAGLAVRSGATARSSRLSQAAAEDDAARARRDRERAEEVARLREDQTRLARDVHDVVGHSLAVILAQAESAQYLDDDPAVLKRTMATIATSARTSLQDVRQVLGQSADHARGPGDLDELVEGVRAGGRDVRSTVVGAPQPLPPELATTAYRVLQELLTNALRHGDRDAPVLVERRWPDGTWLEDLRIEVVNGVPPTAPAADPTPGSGLTGVRRRLEAVGGRMAVRAETGEDGPTFAVTTWVPVRPR